MRHKTDLSSLIYGKVPPQALDLEEAILGACMLEKETFEIVMEVIKSEDVFYSDTHQRIYSCMRRMHAAEQQIDLLTISDGLRKTNELELVGGAYYLTRLTMSVLSTSHVEAHARIVFEKYLGRELIRIASTILSDAYEDSTDVFDLQDKAMLEISRITDGMGGAESTSVGETYIEILMDIEERKDALTDLIGVDSGYTDLNTLTLGWEKGTTILLGARPSQGKTALMLNLAENAVTSRTNAAGEALILSLETSKKPLVRRLAACRCDIPLKTIRKGRLNDFQSQLMLNKIQDFNNLPIKIIDDIFSLNQIVAAIRRQHKKYMLTEKGKSGLPFIVLLDYIQLVKGNIKGNREQEVADISRVLKLLAAELGIILIELCQLNRDVEKRQNKKPMLADIRESGALEQDAHQALLIWHEDLPDDGGERKYNTWLILAKNKDGETGEVKLKFAGDVQRWKNFDDFEQNQPAAGIRGAYQVRDPSIPNVDWNDEF